MIELKKSPVRFVSEGHKYFLGEKELPGITSTLIKKAYPDTYKKPDRYSQEEWDAILANAADKGSNMHETIELYDELGMWSDLPELQSYIHVKEEYNLSVVATEYVVSDEEHYATAIDKVMMTQDGGIILVDFKRTSDLHIENVTLQQSICKRWFEKLNPDIKVSGIYVLWMRDDNWKFQQLVPWADELLDALIDADINGKAFDVEIAYGNLPAMVYDVQVYLRDLEAEVKAKSAELKAIKDGLCNIALEHGVKKFTTEVMQMTTVTPKPRETFDAKAFAEDHPDLYKQYIRKSEVKPSIRITYK